IGFGANSQESAGNGYCSTHCGARSIPPLPSSRSIAPARATASIRATDPDAWAGAVASGLDRGLQRRDQVGPLPGEQVPLGGAPEMAIGRALAIDRLVEPQMRPDPARGQPAQRLER